MATTYLQYRAVSGNIVHCVVDRTPAQLVKDFTDSVTPIVKTVRITTRNANKYRTFFTALLSTTPPTMTGQLYSAQCAIQKIDEAFPPHSTAVRRG